jgi:hypothetical protein
VFSRLGVEIREMRKDDVDFCLSLLRIVGWWNTSEEVERMMHYEPNGCFVAAMEGVDAGIAVSIIYGTISWVENLIVSPEHRGMGVGALLKGETRAYGRSQCRPTNG